MQQSIYLITGVMASGKSTVGELLASRLGRCVHVEGDAFLSMIVSGREEMSETPTAEALRQLHLRYRLTADTARAFFDAGFTAVVQDNYYGEELPRMLSLFEGYPVRTVVLCPSVETVIAREASRGKTGYTHFTPKALYQGFLATTPRIGYWLDSSDQTPEETADTILRHFKG